MRRRQGALREVQITPHAPRCRCLSHPLNIVAEKQPKSEHNRPRSPHQSSEMRFAEWMAGMNVCLSTRRSAGVDKCAELGGLSTRTQDSVESQGTMKRLSTRRGVWVERRAMMRHKRRVMRQESSETRCITLLSIMFG